jgi:hypothetical protein
MKFLPDVGTKWTHRNGNVYTVVGVADMPDDTRYPTTIVYLRSNGLMWSRRADDWHRSMTPAPTDAFGA